MLGLGASAATGAGAGASGSAALTGASAASGIPWNIIIPVGLSLVQGLFGERERAKEKEEMMEMIQPELDYRNQMYNQILGMSPAIGKAVLNQYKRSANWGWPEGKQMDLGWLEQFINEYPGNFLNQGQSGERSQVTRSQLRR